jgi:hypothetical protein
MLTSAAVQGFKVELDRLFASGQQVKSELPSCFRVKALQ